jgi:hypothetical protein
VALAETGVYGLRTNFTTPCFGDVVAHSPAGLAHAQFLDVRAHGKAFCGLKLGCLAYV